MWRVRGVLTNGDLDKVRQLTVKQRRAIGIIYDGTWVSPSALKEGELNDALRYFKFLEKMGLVEFV